MLDSPVGRFAIRYLSFFVAIAATASLGACGGYVGETALSESGATLEGTVKYGKDELQFAVIVVQTPTGGTTGTIKDGKYRIENVPLGEVMIGVNTDAGRGDYQTAAMSGTYKGPDGKGLGKTGIRFIEMPAKFAEPTTSDLKTVINKGSNTYNIEIPR